MSSDTILKDENGVLYSYDNIKTQAWLDGHEPGIEQVAHILLERSKALFALKKDDDAVLLRNLSDEIKETAKAARAHAKKHADEYPEIVVPVSRRSSGI